MHYPYIPVLKIYFIPNALFHSFQKLFNMADTKATDTLKAAESGQACTKPKIPKAWFTFYNSESWQRISLIAVDVVEDLKKEIKTVSNITIPLHKIILKATKKVDDASKAQRLDERKDLALVLNDFDVDIPLDPAKIPYVFGENIWLFADISDGK